MRLRRVGTGRDDRVEAVAARTAASHLDLELEREVALGRAVGEAREHRRERVVGDRAGGVDAGDLARLLHPTQALDQALGGDEVVPGQRLPERPLLRPRDRVRFEPDPGARVEGVGDGLALRRDRGPDLDGGLHAGGAELLGGLRAVAAVGREHEPRRS